MTGAAEEVAGWVGRRQDRDEIVALGPARLLAATLDRTDLDLRPGDALPPPYHLMLFPVTAPQSGLGADGHAARGSFLPPIDLPRRMWAGSRMNFLAPVPIGAKVAVSSEIARIEPKAGRSGALVFVTVRHRIGPTPDTDWIVEEQDLVYRAAAAPADPAPALRPAPAPPAWSRIVKPDPVLLFRYSALTFNSHRIHYDRPYATEIENYPGLVVHGPLLATLLLDLVARHEPAAMVRRFAFRALAPVFDTAPFRLCGRPAERAGDLALWVEDEAGRVRLEAEATLENARP